MPSIPVRVLVFLPTTGFGGAERTILNLVTHTDSSQVEIVLVTHTVVYSGVSVPVLDLSDYGLASGYAGIRRTWRDAFRLVQLAREHKCQVILGFLHYGAIAASWARLLSGNQLKVIASPRTPSRAGIAFHVPTQRARLEWHAQVNVLARLAHRVIVATEGLKTELVEHYGARKEHIHVIANAMDKARIASIAATKIEKDIPLIVTSGRLAPEKDIGTLLHAFALVRAQMPCRLILLGEGPERSALEATARELGVDQDVVFHGFHAEPFAIIKSADVFVHTSRFEGFGNVLIEAMACSVPIVATDCDFGPREIIQHGENGLLAPPNDPEALALAILTVLNDHALAARLVEAADTGLGRYAPNVMTRDYERAIIDLAQG